MLGTVYDYQSMMAILRQRANELHVNRSDPETAKVSGLPDKYLAKLLGPRPVRRIGAKTMGAVLGYLQIKFIAVVDEEAVKRFGNRVQKRDERLVRSGVVQIEFSVRHFKKIGKLGGTNSRKNMTKRRARQLGREAAYVRWNDVKAAVKGETITVKKDA